MEKVEAKIRSETTSKAPESTNNGATNILIAFIEVFFTKFIDLVLALDKVSLTTKLIVIILSVIIGWAVSIIAFFYITVKALKG